MTDQSQDTAGEIDELLDAERSALLRGDLASVQRLKERKEDLLARLAEHPAGLSPEVYASLSEKAARNQTLLAGAARGIAAVQERLQEIRNAQAGEASYDANGRRTAPTRNGSLEKRA